MRRLYPVVPAFLVLWITLALVSDTHRSEAAGPDVATVVTSINTFAVDLYPKLTQGSDNLFFAPYSISTALAMTYAGARGATESQMAKTLYLSGDQPRVHEALGALAADLARTADQGGCKLNVANALWGQKGFPFVKEYQELIAHAYRGQLAELDFQKAPEQSRETINKAVEEQTEGKILDLIPAGLIDASTRLVLTNAIYYKAAWAEAFPKKRTQEAEFTLLDGSKARVPMMHRTGSYGYAEANGLQILELPYKGYAYSLIVFLPKEPEGILELEKSLTSKKLGEWLGLFQERKVSVWLPRFTIKTPSYQLGRVLSAMGMSDAFTTRADFSGINGEKNLCLKDVLHKAFVDVNEEGTEAAAATGAVVKLKAAISSGPEFRADHPFLFVIQHNPTKCILFMGRLARP